VSDVPELKGLNDAPQKVETLVLVAAEAPVEGERIAELADHPGQLAKGVARRKSLMVTKESKKPDPVQRTYDEFLAAQTILEADAAKQRRPAQNDESQFKTAKVKAKAEEKNAYVAAASSEQEKEKAKNAAKPAPKAVAAPAKGKAAAKKVEEEKAKPKKDKAKHLSLDEFTAAAAAASGSAKRGTRGRGGAAAGAGATGNTAAVVVSSEQDFPVLAKDAGKK